MRRKKFFIFASYLFLFCIHVEYFSSSRTNNKNHSLCSYLLVFYSFQLYWFVFNKKKNTSNIYTKVTIKLWLLNTHWRFFAIEYLSECPTSDPSGSGFLDPRWSLWAWTRPLTRSNWWKVAHPAFARPSSWPSAAPWTTWASCRTSQSATSVTWTDHLIQSLSLSLSHLSFSLSFSLLHTHTTPSPGTKNLFSLLPFRGGDSHVYWVSALTGAPLPARPPPSHTHTFTHTPTMCRRDGCCSKWMCPPSRLAASRLVTGVPTDCCFSFVTPNISSRGVKAQIEASIKGPQVFVVSVVKTASFGL